MSIPEVVSAPLTRRDKLINLIVSLARPNDLQMHSLTVTLENGQVIECFVMRKADGDFVEPIKATKKELIEHFGTLAVTSAQEYREHLNKLATEDELMAHLADHLPLDCLLR
jgi:hypothetical protein